MFIGLIRAGQIVVHHIFMDGRFPMSVFMSMWLMCALSVRQLWARLGFWGLLRL